MSADLSNVLDVAVGLAVLFLTLSLLVSTLGEFVSRLFAMRANTLFAGIASLVGSDTAGQIYGHQLVKGLARPGFWDRYLLSRIPGLRRLRASRPSYINGPLFATVIGDLTKGTAGITPSDTIADARTTLRNAIAALPSAEARAALTALVDDAAQRATDTAALLAAYRAGVELWFNTGMERVSGWHKRNMQLVLLPIAFLLAVGLNADSVNVAASLYRDPALRESVVDAATRLVEVESGVAEPLPAELGDALDSVIARVKADSATLGEAGIPLGWGQVSGDDGFAIWSQRLAGWLITTLALSLGAPFWFDILNRLVSLRTSGGKPTVAPQPPGSAAAGRAAA